MKERFEPKVTTCELLREAARELPPGTSAPTLMVDSGVENVNEEVDLLVADNNDGAKVGGKQQLAA
jgi:hypothetical protein